MYNCNEAFTKFTNYGFRGNLEKSEYKIVNNNQMWRVITDGELLNGGQCVK